jgi:hypothetical protein
MYTVEYQDEEFNYTDGTVERSAEWIVVFKDGKIIQGFQEESDAVRLANHLGKWLAG